MQESTLVMLPGLDGTGLLFERFAAALPHDIRTKTISYPADTALSLEDYARVVADALPAGRTVLLAESFSGLVALQLLQRDLFAVSKLILVASPAGMGRITSTFLAPFLAMTSSSLPFIPSQLMRFFCLGPESDLSDVDWLRRVLLQVDPSIIAHRLRLLTATLEILARPLSTPVIYIQATHDHLVPQKAAEYYRACFSDFSLVKQKGPHFLLQVSPLECAEHVAAVVRKSAI